MDLGPKAEMREIRTSGRLCLDRRCSKDSGVALEVALHFAESYRRNGMLGLDIQEFGAQGNNRVLLLFRLGHILGNGSRSRSGDALVISDVH